MCAGNECLAGGEGELAVACWPSSQAERVSWSTGHAEGGGGSWGVGVLEKGHMGSSLRL